MSNTPGHRLNLAVNRYLSNHEEVIDKVEAINAENAKFEKKSASLRKKTQLRPILRNKTRWSSTFQMIDRYTQLKAFLPQSDLELVPLLLDEH